MLDAKMNENKRADPKWGKFFNTPLSVTVEISFIVPFEQPTYQSVHMVHLKHDFTLKHFDIGNHRNMHLHNARASTDT